jgi:hypothetical protein
MPGATLGLFLPVQLEASEQQVAPAAALLVMAAVTAVRVANMAVVALEVILATAAIRMPLDLGAELPAVVATAQRMVGIPVVARARLARAPLAPPAHTMGVKAVREGKMGWLVKTHILAMGLQQIEWEASLAAAALGPVLPIPVDLVSTWAAADVFVLFGDLDAHFLLPAQAITKEICKWKTYYSIT